MQTNERSMKTSARHQIMRGPTAAKDHRAGETAARAASLPAHAYACAHIRRQAGGSLPPPPPPPPPPAAWPRTGRTPSSDMADPSASEAVVAVEAAEAAAALSRSSLKRMSRGRAAFMRSRSSSASSSSRKVWLAAPSASATSCRCVSLKACGGGRGSAARACVCLRASKARRQPVLPHAQPAQPGLVREQPHHMPPHAAPGGRSHISKPFKKLPGPHVAGNGILPAQGGVEDAGVVGAQRQRVACASSSSAPHRRCRVAAPKHAAAPPMHAAMHACVMHACTIIHTAQGNDLGSQPARGEGVRGGAPTALVVEREAVLAVALHRASQQVAGQADLKRDAGAGGGEGRVE